MRTLHRGVGGEEEVVTEMVSSLSIVKPREFRHEPPIEVIFFRYTQEAVPPDFRPRAAKHTVSR
jgi:tRNA-dihydrouridine synthase